MLARLRRLFRRKPRLKTITYGYVLGGGSSVGSMTYTIPVDWKPVSLPVATHHPDGSLEVRMEFLCPCEDSDD